ncbi:Olfactory receptor 5W2 [Fukomys damarensis]|uniref:Olfactory receptor n=2 Tax=Fukomys damarensis TaxID=885580 RepID=A0A091E3P4_FUKDA|nr:Olfactory receptor 5W2 [Fukomys damarensis]
MGRICRLAQPTEMSPTKRRKKISVLALVRKKQEKKKDKNVEQSTTKFHSPLTVEAVGPKSEANAGSSQTRSMRGEEEDENRKMNTWNCSALNEFIFLGITDNTDIKVTLFTAFLLVYLFDLLANLGMVILIVVDPHLHTPMYFFLSHLSFCDLCYSTAIGPKMLVDLVAQKKSIPFLGCALQFLTFCVFADSECLLLAVMAFDRYKAISSPLLYTAHMSSRLCSLLVAGVYLVGLTDALIHTTLAFRLCFCGSNEINHFFCDLPPLYLLSCSDIEVNELALFTVFGFIELSTISGVLVSYFYIILSVMKIHSAEGRFKAFSTCTSHLTAVSVFQGTMLFMYFRPSSSYSLDQDKMTSLFYTLVIPMLNPLIYSLRNKDVKEAVKKLRSKTCL